MDGGVRGGGGQRAGFPWKCLKRISDGARVVCRGVSSAGARDGNSVKTVRVRRYVLLLLLILYRYNIKVNNYYTVQTRWTALARPPTVTPTCLLLIICYPVDAVLHLRHCRPHPPRTPALQQLLLLLPPTTTVDSRDLGLARAHGKTKIFLFISRPAVQHREPWQSPASWHDIIITIFIVSFLVFIFRLARTAL